MRRTLIMAAAALALAACTTSNTIEGQRVRAVAETVTERVEVTGGLHDRAPTWFKNYWREYLARAAGGYATMAVDRKARGLFYVYCSDGGCSQMRHDASSRSFIDVNYKHGALKGCRENVRHNHPAEKPDCAIYAINNKIVWKGRMPWE